MSQHPSRRGERLRIGQARHRQARSRGAEGQPSVRQAIHSAAEVELGRVQDQIRDLLEPESPALQRYRRFYERALPRRGRPVKRDQVIAAAARADVIIVGDYHTLPEAQRAALDLAMEAAAKRRLVLALEMVSSVHQEHVDAYVDGTLDDRGFLEAIDYARTWPFPWAHYRPLLDAARRGAWTVLAVDSTGTARERDAHAAAIVAESRDARPDAVHLVLIGDLHLAPEHLPSAIESEAPDARLAVIHQNEPTVYRDLVERGLEHRTTAVVLGPSRFCLLNATPLRRERSYLAWIEGRWLESMQSVADPAAELTASIGRVSSLLGVATPAIDWDACVGDPTDALAALKDSAPAARVRYARHELRQGGRVLMPELALVVIRQPTVDDLAELSIEALQHALGEPLPVRASARFDESTFIAAVRREALGFLGSCMLHPMRAQGTPGKTIDPLRARGNATTGRSTRALFSALEARVQQGRALRLGGILSSLDAADGWVVARRVGRKLGRRLFAAMVAGRVTVDDVRPLLAPPERRDPRRRQREALLALATLALAGGELGRRPNRPRSR